MHTSMNAKQIYAENGFENLSTSIICFPEYLCGVCQCVCQPESGQKHFEGGACEDSPAARMATRVVYIASKAVP